VKESFYKETRGLGEIKEAISRENLLAGLADAISASADSAETQEPAQASSSSVNPPSEQPSTREKSEKIAKEKEGHEGMERLADFIKANHDELVKSHIPYVVHASTKPVLSEPFVPSRASGRTVSRRVMLTFYETIMLDLYQ